MVLHPKERGSLASRIAKYKFTYMAELFYMKSQFALYKVFLTCAMTIQRQLDLDNPDAPF